MNFLLNNVKLRNRYFNLILVSFFIGAFVFTSKAQITLVNSTHSVSGNVNSYSVVLAVSSPADFLLVNVVTLDQAVTTVSDVSTSTVNMTLGGTAAITSGGQTRMYYSVLPAWSTHTIIIKTAVATRIYAGVEAYNNVDYSSPVGTFTSVSGSAAVAQINVISAAATNDLVVDAIGATPVALTPNGTQTQVYNTNGAFMADGSSNKPGVASTNMKWTMPGGVNWGMVGVSLRYVNTLPIELLSFNGERKDKNVELNWVTATEINNDYFTLERSKDALNFEEIGRVNGAGNSNTQLNYRFTDDKPYDDVSYYRLKQTDLNGVYKYSNIVAVNIKKVEILNFYPNPTTSRSNIIINSPEEISVSFVIVSSDGKVISQRNEKLIKGMNTVNLDVTSLAEGNYIFSIRNFDKVLSQKQFLIK